MDMDLVIRVAPSSTARGRRPVGDVGIVGDRMWRRAGAARPGHREIDADGRLVTPGFVDIHTHLDAQLAWDPMRHVVVLARRHHRGHGQLRRHVRPRAGRRTARYLAEMMEWVEDIPGDAILDGLPWDWEPTASTSARWPLPKGIQRRRDGRPLRRPPPRDGRARLDDAPATADDIAAMAAARRRGDGRRRARVLDVPHAAAPVADGRAVPGTWAAPEELLAIADVMGRHGGASSRPRSRSASATATTCRHRAELAWMEELSSRSGRPVTFGFVQTPPARALTGWPRLRRGAERPRRRIRPQTTARGIGVLFGLPTARPSTAARPGGPCAACRCRSSSLALRDPAAARSSSPRRRSTRLELDLHAFVLPDGPARYDCPPETSLAAHAARRGVSPVEAFLDLAIETDGAWPATTRSSTSASTRSRRCSTTPW